MAKEIEYKFLISDVKKLAALIPLKVERIVQGYLSPPMMASAIRVRISEWADADNCKDEAFITVKGPAEGMSRDEFEYEIPVEDARQMMSLCQGRFIEKIRYFFEHEGHTVEVDIFDGKLAGLIVAEIEVASEDEVVKFPDWFGKDVTLDHRYANSNLCVSGIPE